MATHTPPLFSRLKSWRFLNSYVGVDQSPNFSSLFSYMCFSIVLYPIFFLSNFLTPALVISFPTSQFLFFSVPFVTQCVLLPDLPVLHTSPESLLWNTRGNKNRTSAFQMGQCGPQGLRTALILRSRGPGLLYLIILTLVFLFSLPRLSLQALLFPEAIRYLSCIPGSLVLMKQKTRNTG